jgi:hypothetical protein
MSVSKSSYSVGTRERRSRDELVVTVIRSFEIETRLLNPRKLEYVITSDISSSFIEGSGNDTFGKEMYLLMLGEELYWLSHQKTEDGLGLYFREELKQLSEHISIETVLDPKAVFDCILERIDEHDWLDRRKYDDEEEEPAYRSRRRVALDSWLNS